MANSNVPREFQFLPNLPKANLDDRSFDDLVQECKLRIPRYCQEWTNHNPSDPGITLIELFAWLTDQMLMRFNQVPRLNYVAFLELLGIRLQPPQPARTNLTFYLTKPVTAGVGAIAHIPQGTEVATMRTETEPAVVFTTDKDLVVGKAQIKGFFTAQQATAGQPIGADLTRPRGNNPDWQALDRLRLFETTQLGNCFYIVLAPEDAADGDGRDTAFTTGNVLSKTSADGMRNRITGNVIDLGFTGVVAGSTGIDPNDPPLQWEVWTGKAWVSGILRASEDDHTKGFSFHELQQQGTNVQAGADVRLHLPLVWPEEDFGTGCHGHWIRCVYHQTRASQDYYSYSPLIDRITVRSVGGSVQASECVQVQHEFVGISNGKPGQTFQLEGYPVLKRYPDAEYIIVKHPEGFVGGDGQWARPDPLGEDDSLASEALPFAGGERWLEVQDFGDSSLDDASPSRGPVDSPYAPSTSSQPPLSPAVSRAGESVDDHSSLYQDAISRSLQQANEAKRHYTLDSQTGTLQFGPLIRESSQLQYQTLERTQHQPWGKSIQQFSTRIDLDAQLIASDVST